MKTKIIITLFFSFLYASLSLAQEKEKAIQEVVLRSKGQKYKNKKENPAYAIMQEVWKRKNGLENFKTYQFDEYEKIEFDLNNIDSTLMKRKIFNKIDFIFDYADSTANGKLALPMFLNESVYKKIGINQPEKNPKESLLLRKLLAFRTIKSFR